MLRILYNARVLLVTLLAVIACLYVPACSSQPVPVYTYKIINTFPHDPEEFTEGLVLENGILYEGTGLRGESSIRMVDPKTGNILLAFQLPDQYFGEGITIYKDTIIQLTLDSEKGFIYNKDTLELLKEFTYAGEGWGITHDESRIIISDGTSTLRVMDPVTLKATGQIEVNDNGKPVDMINELEYVNGKIYANIWKTHRIAIIDAATGKISGWIDLTGLLDRQKYGNTPDVLNGIAYDSTTGHLLVTGKLWPVLFEIVLETKLQSPSNSGY
jgi:glutaminyl-peptide cyclotransferase